MKLSNKLLTFLFLLNCPFAFAGTGSAKDGYSIIFILIGILVIIYGTPHLVKASKKIGQLIKHKIERIFNSIKTEELDMRLSNHF